MSTFPKPALGRAHRDRGLSLNPSQIVVLGFSTLVLIGAVLLSLPVAHVAGAPHHWVDDLFIAASAVSITGLASIDPGSSYTLFGQIVLLLLIQIGGFGYMTLFTLIMVLIGRRISMRDRLTVQQATEQPGMTGLIGFIKHVAVFTLSIEAIGIALLAPQLVAQHGLGTGLYYAVFHSVSAFNNAGFSLLPTGGMAWQAHPGVLLTLLALVLIGGLGFTVNHEIVKRVLLRQKGETRWNALLRVVLIAHGALLALAFVAIWAIEAWNPNTLGAMPAHQQIVNALFMAGQPRSGGLHSVDVGLMREATQLLMIPLMFIGGGPGGTAGGVKLTTAAIVLATIVASARGRDDVVLFNLKRRVPEKIVRKALTVVALSGTSVLGAAIVIAAIEPHPFLAILFEVTSAFGTVGLSMGLTPHLSDASKLILIVAMLAGRIGMLTILLAVFSTRQRTAVRYAEEPLLIG